MDVLEVVFEAPTFGDFGYGGSILDFSEHVNYNLRVPFHNKFVKVFLERYGEALF